MICRSCNNPIPNEKLACPRCAEAKGLKALCEYQLHPLRKVYAGEAQLTTRAIAGKRHVSMFGDDERAFCGVSVSTRDRKNKISWTEDDLNLICAACRLELIRLMEKACRASA